MPELIERGYVYIGLPPLYKLKQGKTELYLKDDGALNQYLIGNAVDQAGLRYSVDAPPISGVALEKLLADYQAALDQIDRLSHRCDATLLTTMLELPALDETIWGDEAATAAWLARISARLNNVGLGRAQYRLRIQAATAEHPAALVVERDQHGLTHTQVLPASFIASPEMKPILDIARQLAADLIQPGAEIRRGNAVTPVESFARARAWLMDEAKKGRTIQRFKGLGEMNPEQLWETTVNPETRRLLQVSIEDAVAADQIFSTLMGDVVEPRREFIEANALRVANLDV
jgi:DNA gyrase subunit B